MVPLMLYSPQGSRSGCLVWEAYFSPNEFILAVSRRGSKNLCMQTPLPDGCPPTSTGDKNSQGGKEAASKWVKQLLFYTEMSKAQANFSSPIGGVTASGDTLHVGVFFLMWFGKKQLVLWGLSYRYKIYLQRKPLVSIQFIAYDRIRIWDLEGGFKFAACLWNFKNCFIF